MHSFYKEKCLTSEHSYYTLSHVISNKNQKTILNLPEKGVTETEQNLNQVYTIDC